MPIPLLATDDAWIDAHDALLTAEHASESNPVRTAAYRAARAALMTRLRTAPRAEKNTSPGGLTPWQIQRVRTYIDENLTLPLSRKHLAAQTRLSSSAFGRAFKFSFGIPPHAYVVDRRLARSRVLMLTTKTPLSVIALDCGFTDQAHFCRLFRRHMGWSPAAWRRAAPVPVGGSIDEDHQLKAQGQRAC